MKKKELEYRNEALYDEIDTLEIELHDIKEKLWEVIQENDRLTMTYEPYRPPGDKHEGLEFYGLVEENDMLTQKVLDKMEIINEVEEENRRLLETNRRLTSELVDVRKAVCEMTIAKEPKKRMPKAGVISFDFWPPRDWFRLGYDRYHPGMASQLRIGPIRIEWFAL